MRILLVRLSAMGDVVQAIGAMQSLAAARPDDTLGVVTQRAYRPLIEAGLPRARVLEHDRYGGVRGYLRTVARLRAWRPDVAVDLQGNWKAAGLVRASGATRRIGVVGPGRREPSSARLLNERVREDSVLHPAGAAFAAIRAVAPAAKEMSPHLSPGPEALREAQAELAALGVGVDEPFTIRVVGVPEDPRSWPVEFMARGASATDIWLVGPDEANVAVPAGARVLRQGPGSLLRLIALGSICAAAGGVVLGPDQGAVHVLAAAGARCQVLYGPQDPARTAPPAAAVVLHPDPPDCMPCRARVCRHPDGAVCMRFGVE